MAISRVLPASGCLTAIVLMLCPISNAAEDKQENASGKRALARRVIRPFNYDGVTLLPSMHRSQQEQVRDYYMRHLRPNDVLRGFRLKQRDWCLAKNWAAHTVSDRSHLGNGWAASHACTVRRATLYCVTGCCT